VEKELNLIEPRYLIPFGHDVMNGIRFDSFYFFRIKSFSFSVLPPSQYILRKRENKIGFLCVLPCDFPALVLSERITRVGKLYRGALREAVLGFLCLTFVLIKIKSILIT
jgi:hypothetical protein